jgi:RecB family exonuclease
MSAGTEAMLDDFLSDMAVSVTGFTGSDDDGTENVPRTAWREPGYEGKIDYRIRQLSYSSLLTLHSCPRKFQLNRLRSTHRAEESLKSTITFSYGHVVGEAIQLALQNVSEDQIIWQMFRMWHTPDLFDRDDKGNKSFWEAVIAIQRFLSLRAQGFLNDYDLVYFDGKPACELSFAITFPDGFRLRGYVDAVLRNRESGEVIVLECKTTGAASLNPATYKNSAQAIGYSIVLDHIYPELSSYSVIYLIYQTKSREYTPIPFQKSYLQRALWIRELLLDIETVKMYEEAEVYPMRGESCFTFFRECEYFNTCTLSTQYLTKPCTPEEEDTVQYQINLTLNDLLESQLSKVTE